MARTARRRCVRGPHGLRARLGAPVRLAAWGGVLACLFVMLPPQFGGHLGLTLVSGHSMQPTFHGGDLLLTWRTEGYRVGQVLVYRIPEGEVGAGIRVVHRVVEARPDGTYRTQGDNNRGEDSWYPRTADVQGKVLAAVPHGGLLLRWMLSPLALAVLCGVLTALVVAQPASPTPRRGHRGSRDGRGGRGRRRDFRGQRHATRSPSGRPRPATVVLTVLGLLGAAMMPASAASFGHTTTARLYAMTRTTGTGGAGGGVTYTQTMGDDHPLSYCANVEVHNDGPSTIAWEVAIDLSLAPFNASTITSSWNVTQVSFAASVWVVKGVGYNSTLAPGASTTFGYCGERSNTAPYVESPASATVDYTANGQYCGDVHVTTASHLWVRWRAVIGHSTPGLTDPKYWLTAEPTIFSSAVSDGFNPGTGTWYVVGVAYNEYIREGSPATFRFCAPLAP